MRQRQRQRFLWLLWILVAALLAGDVFGGFAMRWWRDFGKVVPSRARPLQVRVERIPPTTIVYPPAADTSAAVLFRADSLAAAARRAPAP